MDKQKILELKKIATDIRLGAVEAVYNAKSGHPGGALSSADILACLYFSELNVDVNNPKWEERDRFVLSKGHSCPGLYSALALKGFFPAEELKSFRHTGALLQGHPDMKAIKGVDMSAGSLGQVWRLQARWMAKIIVHMPLSVMAKAKRVRFGRQLCLPHTISLTTFV